MTKRRQIRLLPFLAHTSSKIMLKKVFKYLLAGLFLFSGISHFLDPDFFLKIMPPYLPYHLELIYVSGVFEIICGVGLLIKRTQRLAAWGIILMLISFFPVHIYMCMYPERFPDVPAILLTVRIVLQFGMIYLAYLYTKVGAKK